MATQVTPRWRQAPQDVPQLASSATARDINRDQVLDLIRSRQPIARVDIARQSGLQPSTVSLIVEQLLEERWIVQSEPADRPRGRKPTLLSLNGELLLLAVDLRPGHAVVAVLDLQNRLLLQHSIQVCADPVIGTREMIDAIEQVRAFYPTSRFEGIGISFPGRVDAALRKLMVAPHLAWTEFDVAGVLEDGCGLQVEIENEANVCLVDELWSGRLAGYRSVLLVTVSEGIGAAMLINGQMVYGKSGLAGELGHVPLDPEGPLCACGRRGCWETFASSTATLQFYAEQSGMAAPNGMGHLVEMAKSGDAYALKAMRNQAVQLARGLQLAVTMLAPELVIASVDLVLLWPDFEATLAAELQAHMLAGEPPQLKVTSRSELSRLRGAAAMVLDRHAGYHRYRYLGGGEYFGTVSPQD